MGKPSVWCCLRDQLGITDTSVDCTGANSCAVAGDGGDDAGKRWLHRPRRVVATRADRDRARCSWPAAWVRYSGDEGDVNSMLSRLDRLAYHSQHLSFLINATVMQEAARIATRTPRVKISKEILKELQRRRHELHRTDLANVEAGLYPRELLFDIPTRRYLRDLPKLLADARHVVKRKHDNNYKDIPAVDKDRFPPYYRRTFHWQSGGYFSEFSAQVYELGVELLFRGTADVMRRQIIPPITRWLADNPGDARLLDVGCGTGRTLHQLAAAHPHLRLHGADMSPAYIKQARKRLIDLDEVTLAAENAEALPWADGDVRHRDERLHVPRAAAQRAPQRAAGAVPRGPAGWPGRDRGFGAALRERVSRARAARVSRASSTSRSMRITSRTTSRASCGKSGSRTCGPKRISSRRS